VLTFDERPLPRNSNQVLQILADQCVKATFFIIGQQRWPARKAFANTSPPAIDRLSQPAPSADFNKMTTEQAKQEIDAGSHRLRRRSATPRSCAVLADSGPVRRRPRRAVRASQAYGSGAPIFWLTTGTTFRLTSLRPRDQR